MAVQNIEITKKESGNRVTIVIKGYINTDTAPALNDELMKLDYGNLDLTIDFSNTDYITSAGLRTLLIARKKLSDDTMRIVHANSEIMEIFETTGFDSLIRIKNTSVTEEYYRYSFPALLQKCIEVNNDSVAYIYKDKKYTWKDVDKASHIIANDLASIGVKKGTHVGICSANSINWIFSFFAIQKLGAIAVLFNPGLKPSEVCSISEIADVTHLCYAEIPNITTFELYKDACINNSCVTIVYDISDRIDFNERYNEYDSICKKYREYYNADDAGIVIFSSGSTGKPKAILSSAYNCTASMSPLIESMNFERDDINLAFLPMFHIFGFSTGVCASLLCGYCSVIPENKYPDTMINLIETYRCTIFNTVPTMMLAVVASKNFLPEKLKSLRLSILGGSATTPEQMSMLKSILPTNHFANIYGMSENPSVSLTEYEDSIEHITESVGKPVPGLELVIRDPNTRKELLCGSEGEICIRSDTMVVCYYKLDIDKQPIDDEGWLATGDLGFLDNDGYLHITGRLKDLIICGGENISPGEIADVLSQIDEISDVKVIGLPDAIKGEIVAAAVTVKSGCKWNEDAVRQYASDHLAKYKLPVHYFVLDSFPLLGTGKIDSITLKKQLSKLLDKSVENE